MRNIKHDHRRRPRKQSPKRTLTLIVEALEPRLVLSAVGFGFDEARGHFDSHQRDTGHGDVYRPAFMAPRYDQRGNLPFDMSSDRVESAQPRGGRPDAPFTNDFVERGGHGGRLGGRPPEPMAFFGKPDGESPLSTFEFVNDSVASPPPHTAATVPSMTLIVVSLTPTSALRGGDLLTFGQLLARPSSQQTSPIRSVNQPSNSTLPIVMFDSPSAPSRTTSTSLYNNPPSLRSDATPSGSDAASGQAMKESASGLTPGLAVFVSLTTSNLPRSWNIDSTSFEAVFESASRIDDSIQPTGTSERAIVSSRDSTPERASRLSEDLLWAGVSEGGFIDVDTDAAGSSRERSEFAEDAEDFSLSKRLSKQMRRDEFWFDFANTRFDLLLNSTDLATFAEEQSSDSAASGDEAAWLRDDGGMIVLTSAQFTEQVAAAVMGDSNQSPTGAADSREIDIPMDAGIGVFQAIEVATTLVEQTAFEQNSDAHAADGSTAAIEGEATAGSEFIAPPVEQAATNSESDQPGAIRAAAMPLLLAISAFLQRGRENREKVAERQRRV